MLGAWLAGCVFMDMVATQNFRSVDRLLAAPPPQIAERIQAMGGQDLARAFLRYQASELNRSYFDNWERAQIVLGVVLFVVVLFVVLLFGSTPNRLMLLLTLLMLGIVLVMHFYLTPEIIRLGRVIDFVSPGTPSPDRARFWTFHGAYSACELVKFGLGTVVAVLLVRRRRRGEPLVGPAGQPDGPAIA